MPSQVQTLQREIAALRAENKRLRAANKAGLAHKPHQFASILLLPTELLDKIFAQLAKRRSDIAACRLTCREFHGVSSPYLITSITFSRRLATLSKLVDVIEHPYFSQHVTELVWDASYWDAAMATDFDEYSPNAMSSTRRYRDKKADAERIAWGTLWSRLSKDFGMTERTSRRPFSAFPDGHEYRTPFEDCYLLGQHQYSRFWIAQKAMNDRKVPDDIFRTCLRKLPKLKSLIYTDFRAFGKEGDRNYDRFCQRTIGHAAPPRHLSNMDVDDGLIYQDLWMIFETMSQMDSTAIKSFLIGSNPFGIPLSSRKYSTSDDTLPRALSHRFLGMQEPSAVEDHAIAAFRGFQELRLPQRFEYIDAEDDEEIEMAIAQSIMPKLLEACTFGLTKLTFTAEDLVYWYNAEGTPSCWSFRDGGADALERILFPAHFRQLRYLDLRGWVLHRTAFSDFLLRHKATLRQLRLAHNLTVDDEGKADHVMASTIGPQLALEAVTVANVPGDWIQQPAADGSLPHMRGFPPSYTEDEMLELEGLWLSGRSNPPATMLKSISVSREWTWRDIEGWAD